MTLTPADAIDAANALFGKQHGHRALHAKGIVLSGSFRAKPAAAELTTAAHMQGEPVELVARFSNGGGHPHSKDFLPEVRGFALKFYLPDGSRTDLVAQTAPQFPVSTPEQFVAMLRAAGAGLPGALVEVPRFLATHPRAAARLARNTYLARPPASFATIPYYAIHAFRMIAAGGAATHVRYTLQPVGPVRRIDPLRAARRGPDYLHEEIAARVAREPVEFRLEVQIAEPGDPVNDPSIDWPSTRRRMVLGTVTLTALDQTRERDGDVLVFDPTRVTPGIELTDDPVLLYRHGAYGESVARRS